MNTSTTSGAMYSAEPHLDREEERHRKSVVLLHFAFALRVEWRGGARGVTGVVSSGVVMGVQALLSFTPLPRSKSQIFTGETWWRQSGGGLSL